MQQIKNASKSAATIVEPTGVSIKIEARIPKIAQKTERIAEKTITDLKFLKMRMEESAGKIIKAEISKEPTRFIARTITTAIITAIKRL